LVKDKKLKFKPKSSSNKIPLTSKDVALFIDHIARKYLILLISGHVPMFHFSRKNTSSVKYCYGNNTEI